MTLEEQPEGATVNGAVWPDWKWRGDNVLVHKSGQTVTKHWVPLTSMFEWACAVPKPSSYHSVERMMTQVESWALAQQPEEPFTREDIGLLCCWMRSAWYTKTTWSAAEEDLKLRLESMQQGAKLRAYIEKKEEK